MNYSIGGRLFPLWLWLCAVACLMARPGSCNVVLMANSTTLSFSDVEATFTPAVKGSGVNGVIYTVEPLDACSPLRKRAVEGSVPPFALVIRGGCQFDDKVRNAQNAGFKAVVVYDNKDHGVLVSMAGSSSGIHTYAVFISKSSGEVLKKYSGQSDAQLWIISTHENSAWSIMAISFTALLAMSAVLATCFFVRRHQIRRDMARIPAAREFHGMSSQLVKAMPSLIFTKVEEDNCTSSTCAICLEDYSVGEKIRVLPCRHKFHAACVDLWLTSWRTFCPVCKRDANAGASNLPASESTPLLSSATHLPAESTALSSFRSMVAASPPRSISRHSSSQSISRTHSNSCMHRTSTPCRSYSNSPAISTSRSNVDLANMSSPWSHTSHLASAHSNSCMRRTSNPCRSYSNSPAISTSRSNIDLANMSSPWSHTSHLASAHSNSCMHCTSNPCRSYSNSPGISTSRSNVDLANMSSPWSHTSHLASVHSPGRGHLSPPISIRYTSQHVSRSSYGVSGQYLDSSHIPCSGYGSPSYYPGSSGQQYPYLRQHMESGQSSQSPQHAQLQHGGDSGMSLSASASTQSLYQAYLQHCPESDASLSAQSLPGC